MQAAQPDVVVIAPTFRWMRLHPCVRYAVPIVEFGHTLSRP